MTAPGSGLPAPGAAGRRQGGGWGRRGSELPAPGGSMSAGSDFLARPCPKRAAGSAGVLPLAVLGGESEGPGGLEGKHHPSLGRGSGKGKQRVWQKNHEHNQPLVALSKRGLCWHAAENGSPSLYPHQTGWSSSLCKDEPSLRQVPRGAVSQSPGSSGFTFLLWGPLVQFVRALLEGAL